MPEYTRHDEGTFSWADLSTTDTDAARRFYSAVFGWELDVQQIPEEAGGGVYIVAKRNGKDVCAIQEQRADQRDAGVPPMWNAYFTVEDVDTKAKEIEANGGTVHAPPFDVMTAGRMTVAQDPTGGFFSLWQAKDTIGAYVLAEPNTLRRTATPRSRRSPPTAAPS
ncbi:MAG: VOC family protein [Actinomycetota bacterium]